MVPGGAAGCSPSFWPGTHHRPGLNRMRGIADVDDDVNIAFVSRHDGREMHVICRPDSHCDGCRGESVLYWPSYFAEFRVEVFEIPDQTRLHQRLVWIAAPIPANFRERRDHLAIGDFHLIGNAGGCCPALKISFTTFELAGSVTSTICQRSVHTHADVEITQGCARRLSGSTS